MKITASVRLDMAKRLGAESGKCKVMVYNLGDRITETVARLDNCVVYRATERRGVILRREVRLSL